MADLDKAVATQIENIQKKTGKSLEELSAIVEGCGFSKHGEIRDFLKRELGLGHGDANTLVHIVKKSDGASAAKEKGLAGDAVLDAIYTGPKAALRPIHERLMEVITPLGEFEIAPKKGYVSLRRQKQFAMLGPATNTRFELGLNAKGLAPSDRLVEMPPKGMCDFKVKLTSPGEVDAELVGWIQVAFEQSGARGSSKS
ncbi:MAG: DUF4287 domain-containing protein [Isosphaeraceae bacterium]|nr:DUF4287 domain-containing protein [Isosphaeraceae bacterium]